jgi:hypothetical protein
MLLSRARKRFVTHAANTHKFSTGTPKPTGSRLELCIIPRFPARQLCEQEELKALVQKNWTPWRGIMFPDQVSAVLSQQESAIVLRATRALSIFEVNTWGMLFYVTRIDRDHGGTEGIHLREFTGFVLIFIQHAGNGTTVSFDCVRTSD